MNIRTSNSHPLRIDSLNVPGCTGTIGLTFCPGKKGPSSLGSYTWNRDLATDAQVIAAWNPDIWLCLMEPNEMEEWDVHALPAVAGEVAKYFNLPIKDVQAPGKRFAAGWAEAGPAIRACLRAGGKVLIHCRGGLGRAGTVAAQLLVEFGQQPGPAIDAVRKARDGAIENSRQEDYIHALLPRLGIAHAQAKEGLTRVERARGGLLGLLVGDALGVPHEFKSAEQIRPRESINMVMPDSYRRSYAQVPYGTWSDDGAQTLCLLASLLANKRLVLEDFGQRLLNWRDHGYMAVGGERFDIGNQTKTSLTRLRAGVAPLEAGGNQASPPTNGSLMRVLGLALWHRGSSASMFEMAMRQSMVTHGNRIAQLCCALYCGVARQLLAGVDAAQAWELAIDKLQHYCQADAELALVLQRDILDSPLRNAPRGSGHAVDALWSAQACLREPDYASVVRAAIAMGNDTDTTAALAGGLAGIIFGKAGIPAQWLAEMRGFELAEPALRGLDMAQARPSASASPSRHNPGRPAAGAAPTLAQTLSRHSLGRCQRYQNLSVFPLLAPTGLAASYDLLDSAIAAGAASVAEISEGGSVPELAFHNRGGRPVLLVDGQELSGARQNRILNITILADAGSELRIPVSCVERGRWAYRQRHFDSSERILFGAARRAKASAVSQSMRQRGAASGDQGEIWQMIEERFRSANRNSDTEAMSDLYAAEQPRLDACQRAFEWQPRQAGAVFAIDGQPIAVELFDSPDTFRSFLRKAVGSFAMDALSTRSPVNIEPALAHVESFLQQVGHAGIERFKAVGAGTDLRLAGQHVAGGALEVKGQLLHLSAFRL